MARETTDDAVVVQPPAGKPAATSTRPLDPYPSVGHTIYKEDYEATIAAAGATVVIRVTDGNDRQIDDGKTAPDRQPHSGRILPLANLLPELVQLTEIEAVTSSARK